MLVIVDVDARCDVHCIHEAEPFLDTTLSHSRLNLGRDIDERNASFGFKPEFFAIRFHRCYYIVIVTSFQPFGADHQAVLGLISGVGLALLVGARWMRRVKEGDRLIRYLLALILVGVGFGSWVFDATKGFIRLPFHLCDLTLVLVVWALLRPSNSFVGQLAFLWALAGSTQAILTPDLSDEFPSYQWFRFFLMHCGAVLSALYLKAQGYIRLSLISVWRVWLLTNAYAAAAGLVNWFLGTNFGYLARKPEQPSVLDYLGPWPYYILGGEILALVLFFCCYALSRMVDQWAGDRQRERVI